MINSFTLTAQLTKQISGYTLRKVNNYSVYIENNALRNHADRTEEAVTKINHQLIQIDALDITADVLAFFKTVPIFIDWDKTDGGAVFHPSKEWLLQNGYIAEKEKSVNIVNVENYLNWTKQNQPYIMLHELTHAYHFIVLGYDYLPIAQAYKAAMNEGLYDKVDYWTGARIEKYKKAYAATNNREYFSEITEAFFGKNDYYPFVRTDLEKHDPRGYKLMQDVWQFKSKTVAPITFDPNRYYKLSTDWLGNSIPLTVDDKDADNTNAEARQKWKITDIGDGYYRLTTAWQGDSKALDVINDGTNNKLHLTKTANVSGQQWKITNIGGGHYRLTTAWQGKNKSLSIVEKNNGYKLELSNTTNSRLQHWFIQLAD